MTLSRADIAASVVLVCHRLGAKGFVAATDGNVSARIPNGNILITPSSVNKGLVGERMLVEVRADGMPVTLDRAPSTELGMHCFVYHERPDVRAIVHAHPPYATGFAVARQTLGGNVLPEVILGLGTVPLAEYATPSTTEVAESLAPHVRSANAVLLSNHGVVAFGENVDEAYYRLEKVEQAAQIMFIARLLGGPHELTLHQVERLRTTVARSGSVSPVPPTMQHPDRELTEDEIKTLIRSVLAETHSNR